MHYLTDNTLVDVFTRNFKGLHPCSTTKTYDYWLPTMNLPLVLRSYEPDTEPYLVASQSYVDKWREKLPKRGKIYSFNWTGSSNFSQNMFRDIPIDYLLSKVGSSNRVNICMETSYNPECMIDLRNEVKSWEDTLAILHLSDMVFSSCSSVAHAAGVS